MEGIYIYYRDGKEYVTPSFDVALRFRGPNTDIYYLQNKIRMKVDV